MITSQQEMFAVKFAGAIAGLKALGLRGEVVVRGGLVMISTSCKFSATQYRKNLRSAQQRNRGLLVETRPIKGAYVFTFLVA